jgi:hypothetical protein
MIEVLFFLLVKAGNGLAFAPAPFATEAACKAEAARINRPSKDGGLVGVYADCVRVEKRAA